MKLLPSLLFYFLVYLPAVFWISMGFGAWKVGRQEREELETSSLKLLHDALVLFLSCQVFKVGSSSRQHIYHFFRDMVHGCLLSWSLALNKCILCLTNVLLIAMCSFR